MPNFCTKVMQHVLKQKSEFTIFFNLEQVNFRVTLIIFYHEKDHFLLELLSYVYVLGAIVRAL